MRKNRTSDDIAASVAGPAGAAVQARTRPSRERRLSPGGLSLGLSMLALGVLSEAKAHSASSSVAAAAVLGGLLLLLLMLLLPPRCQAVAMRPRKASQTGRQKSAAAPVLAVWKAGPPIGSRAGRPATGRAPRSQPCTTFVTSPRIRLRSEADMVPGARRRRRGWAGPAGDR